MLVVLIIEDDWFVAGPGDLIKGSGTIRDGLGKRESGLVRDGGDGGIGAGDGVGALDGVNGHGGAKLVGPVERAVPFVFRQEKELS